MTAQLYIIKSLLVCGHCGVLRDKARDNLGESSYRFKSKKSTVCLTFWRREGLCSRTSFTILFLLLLPQKFVPQGGNESLPKGDIYKLVGVSDVGVLVKRPFKIHEEF
ncbi:hypothetical protein MAR_011591 [Mya arenaria]|uniref:Uncharacterized protein n=1 Tax=Mya arenaria TaxID=6604 RepID=A0ABY7FXX7_MYAAR|nr:hypothetical protein MAR_011591 [Mya arenaria]